MEKRSAIRPATKSMLGDGPMQTETTNRHDFVPTSVPRPEVIIPCDNIRMRDDVPLEGNTTAGLSYIDPGPVLPVQSFKPRAEYMKCVMILNFHLFALFCGSCPGQRLFTFSK